MTRIVIFGNSGSGKSTLASELAETRRLAHFDLDTIAWLTTTPPVWQALETSKTTLDEFVRQNAEWVIEGCYADLIELVLAEANQMIFMDLPVSACQENTRRRPWEPKKYESKEAQNANLSMLPDWIAQYDERDDAFSRAAHEAIFERFHGKKVIYNSNERPAHTAPRKVALGAFESADNGTWNND